MSGKKKKKRNRNMQLERNVSKAIVEYLEDSTRVLNESYIKRVIISDEDDLSRIITFDGVDRKLAVSRERLGDIALSPVKLRGNVRVPDIYSASKTYNFIRTELTRNLLLYNKAFLDSSEGMIILKTNGFSNSTVFFTCALESLPEYKVKKSKAKKKFKNMPTVHNLLVRSKCHRYITRDFYEKCIITRTTKNNLITKDPAVVSALVKTFGPMVTNCKSAK